MNDTLCEFIRDYISERPFLKLTKSDILRIVTLISKDGYKPDETSRPLGWLVFCNRIDSLIQNTLKIKLNISSGNSPLPKEEDTCTWKMSSVEVCESRISQFNNTGFVRDVIHTIIKNGVTESIRRGYNILQGITNIPDDVRYILLRYNQFSDYFFVTNNTFLMDGSIIPVNSLQFLNFSVEFLDENFELFTQEFSVEMHMVQINQILEFPRNGECIFEIYSGRVDLSTRGILHERSVYVCSGGTMKLLDEKNINRIVPVNSRDGVIRIR